MNTRADALLREAVGGVSATAHELAAEARRLYSYDPETGAVTWRRRSGMAAGSDNGRGYRRVTVLGRSVRAHRVAWLLHYGEWPSLQVDHINGDRADNRIANLRLATNAQNQANAQLSPRNTSGYKGVDYHKLSGKWRALVNVNGKRKHLGLFDTPEAAHAAYQRAAAVVYGEFARAEKPVQADTLGGGIGADSPPNAASGQETGQSGHVCAGCGGKGAWWTSKAARPALVSCLDCGGTGRAR